MNEIYTHILDQVSTATVACGANFSRTIRNRVQLSSRILFASLRFPEKSALMT